MPPVISGSAPPSKNMPGLVLDQNRHPNLNYGGTVDQSQGPTNAVLQYEDASDLNVMANATSNSDESLMFQGKQKSLEVITER